MKLLFAHDHIFYKYKDQYYSTGGLSKEMLERYTKVFEKVTVISRQKVIDRFDEKLTLASTDRVEFIEIPNFKSLKTISKLYKAKKIIRNEVLQSDYLLSRLPSSIGSIALNYAKKNKTPNLTEVVACPWDALWNYNYQGKILAPFAYLQMKNQIKNAQYTIYVTNSFLQKRYPTNGKSTSCSNVVLKDFDKTILEKRIKKINNKSELENLIIGTTAAVNVKYKGQKYVIEAIGQLKKEGITNIKYELVGGGNTSYLKSVVRKNQVEDQVNFLGTMPHNKIFDWLDTIDLYSQPSRQEGLPRALIEAMSRALPSFGAKTAGIPELIENNYIFSNTSSNIKEIKSIIYSLTKEKLTSQATRNYKEAKNYGINIIEKRREKFLFDFKKNFF